MARHGPNSSPSTGWPPHFGAPDLVVFESPPNTCPATRTGSAAHSYIDRTTSRAHGIFDLDEVADHRPAHCRTWSRRPGASPRLMGAMGVSNASARGRVLRPERQHVGDAGLVDDGPVRPRRGPPCWTAGFAAWQRAAGHAGRERVEPPPATGRHRSTARLRAGPAAGPRSTCSRPTELVVDARGAGPLRRRRRRSRGRA